MRHFSLIQLWPALLTPNLLRPRAWVLLGQLRQSHRLLARIMHRFSSRSGESAGLSALLHTRGHPLAGRAVRPSDFGDAVDNLCIMRANLRAGGNCPYQRGASPFPILASSDLRSWTGPATTRTECSRETYCRTAFWKVSGVTRSRRTP